MRKLTILLCFVVPLLINVNGKAQTKSFYDLSAVSIGGDTIDFSLFKGQKILLVNTASKCGFTGQYKDLQEMYEKYGGTNFTIIGFPSNDFLRQEPGTDNEIKEFCEVNYGVTFQMMSKISVKGKDIHPVYIWLTTKEENGVMDSKVKWNFQKYMIDENGKLVDYANPKDSPNSEKIISWIEEEG